MKSERERIKHSGIRICSEMRKRERKERKGDRMDDKDMKQEGQNGKRKGWGIEREKLFFFCFLELLV
jgi:hypothetical protein